MMTVKENITNETNYHPSFNIFFTLTNLLNPFFSVCALKQAFEETTEQLKFLLFSLSRLF